MAFNLCVHQIVPPCPHSAFRHPLPATGATPPHPAFSHLLPTSGARAKNSRKVRHFGTFWDTRKAPIERTKTSVAFAFARVHLSPKGGCAIEAILPPVCGPRRCTVNPAPGPAQRSAATVGRDGDLLKKCHPVPFCATPSSACSQWKPAKIEWIGVVVEAPITEAQWIVQVHERWWNRPVQAALAAGLHVLLLTGAGCGTGKGRSTLPAKALRGTGLS